MLKNKIIRKYGNNLVSEVSEPIRPGEFLAFFSPNRENFISVCYYHFVEEYKIHFSKTRKVFCAFSNIFLHFHLYLTFITFRRSILYALRSEIFSAYAIWVFAWIDRN